MSKHYPRIFQLFVPALDPLEGVVAGVLVVAEGLDGFFDGDVAVAHHAIGHFALFDDAVFEVDVFYLAAEVADGGGNAFVVEAVGMMHVPERAAALSHFVQETGKQGTSSYCVLHSSMSPPSK